MTADDWYAQLGYEEFFWSPDELLMSAAGDWFEENGEPSVAFALRWMRDEGKRPRPDREDRKIKSWDFFDAQHHTHRDPDDLPHDVFQHLFFRYPNRRYVENPSYKLAVESLAYALEKSGVLQEKE